MNLQGGKKEKKTVTSLELVDQINIFRKEDGNNSVLRHADLLKKIEAEFAEEIDQRIISPVSYKGGNGQQRKMYELSGDDALQLLNSESRFVRKQTVKLIRGMEEEISKMKLPQTKMEWIEFSMEQEKENLRLSETIEEQKPAVELKETIVASDRMITIGEACRLLNTGKKRLMEWLRINGFLLKKGTLPLQKYINSGLLDYKVDLSNPNSPTPTLMFTTKGFELISRLIKDDVKISAEWQEIEGIKTRDLTGFYVITLKQGKCVSSKIGITQNLNKRLDNFIEEGCEILDQHFFDFKSEEKARSIESFLKERVIFAIKEKNGGVKLKYGGTELFAHTYKRAIISKAEELSADWDKKYTV